MNQFRTLLSVVILLFSATSFAELQRDKEEDIFYKFGAGARFRQYYFQDSTAGAQPYDEDYITSSHRAQIDLTISKGEYFKTYFRAIHRGDWGAQDPDQDNFLIQQAWGDWKVTDFLNLRFGRQAIQIGRGLVYGYNEWENSPNFYDGFTGHFDWEALEFSLYGLKLYELEKVPNVSYASDPEVSHFILDINFKQISDYIQLASLNLVQVDGDVGQLPNTTTLLTKQSIQRFGFDLITDGVNFRTAATLNYVTGTEKSAAGEEKVKQLMMDGEARLLLPDWENFNFWAGFHSDSGDDDPTDGFNTQYEPLNYNFHVNAGRLDFLKFGNLTFARTGASMDMLGGWEVGIEGFLFQKTKAGANTNFFRTPIADEFAAGTYALGNDKDLGTEVDLWISRTFASGVNLEISLNFFKPGKALKTANDITGAVPLSMDNQIYNLIVDVGYFF
ncbi:MAG: alginate export family protein [Bdellovibrionaceae bacterium]|nr:alginate export family protein [Pseudobdellovibrionaceae bacterium]